MKNSKNQNFRRAVHQTRGRVAIGRDFKKARKQILRCAKSEKRRCERKPHSKNALMDMPVAPTFLNSIFFKKEKRKNALLNQGAFFEKVRRLFHLPKERKKPEL
jgi:hypothetical protein